MGLCTAAQRGLHHNLAGPGLGGLVDGLLLVFELVPQGAEGAGGLAAGGERGDRGPLEAMLEDEG